MRKVYLKKLFQLIFFIKANPNLETIEKAYNLAIEEKNDDMIKFLSRMLAEKKIEEEKKKRKKNKEKDEMEFEEIIIQELQKEEAKKYKNNKNILKVAKLRLDKQKSA